MPQPLNEAQRRYLISQGYNPDEYELATPEEVARQQSPAASPSSDLTNDKPGFFGALGRSAARNFPATMAGLAAGAQVSIATAAGGPFVSIPAGFVAGIGAAIGTRKLQDVAIENLLPTQIAEAYTQSEIQDRTHQPLASTAGEILASLPALRPSVSALKSAGRGAVNLLTPNKPVNATDLANLLNAGLGSTVPTGIRYATDPNVTAGELLLEAGGGALFNTPTKLGQGLGLIADGVPSRPVKTNDKRLQAAQRNLTPETRIQETSIPVQDMPAQGESIPISEIPKVIDSFIRSDAFKEATKELNLQRAAEALEEAKANQLKGASENRPKPLVTTETGKEIFPDYTGNMEIDNEITARTPRKEAEDIQEDFDLGRRKQEDSQLEGFSDSLNQKVQDKINKTPISDFNKGDTLYTKSGRPLLYLGDTVSTKDGKRRIIAQSVETGTQDSYKLEDLSLEPNLKRQEESDLPLAPAKFKAVQQGVPEANIPDVELWNLTENVGDKVAGSTVTRQTLENLGYKVPERPKNQEVNRTQELLKGLKENKLSTTPTKELSEAFKKLGVNRNVKVEDSGRVFTAEGKEISGMTYIRDGLKETAAFINPSKAAIDTYPHEIFHSFFDDLKKLGDSKSRGLVNRAYRAVEQTDAYKNWAKERRNKNQDSSSEEYITQLVGEDTIRRVLNTDKKGSFRNWMSDFWSYVKDKMGSAKDSDYIKILSDRLISDPDFADTFARSVAKVKNVGDASEVKQQEESRISTNENARDLSNRASAESMQKMDELLELVQREFPNRDKKMNTVIQQDLIDSRSLGKETEGVFRFMNKTGELPDFAFNELMDKLNEYREAFKAANKSFKIDSDSGGEEQIIRNQDSSPLERPKTIKPNFYLETPDFLRSDKLGFPRVKFIDGKEIINRLQNKYPAEYAVLKDLGIEDFLNSEKRQPEAVARWIEENGPKVEVRELEAQPKTSVQKENPYSSKYHSLVHELETKGLPTNEQDIQDLPKEVQDNHKELLLDYLEVSQQYLGYNRESQLLEQDERRANQNESATRRYKQVNPKPLSKMPGAVDLLVKKPYRDQLEPDEIAFGFEEEDRMKGIKYRSSHYPQEGKNLLAHVRGYFEEKEGRKIFHIFELQSDWAQEYNKRIKDLETEEGQRRFRRGLEPDPEMLNDPLLKHYERLAVKAAIKHAKDNGADSIAISDAETAMITEEHDQYAVTDVLNVGEEIAPLIPQEKGMRLHYDKTIPKILEELTGSKSSIVDFGPHKNAVKTTRNDLIFKNPDGTPKINITAREYPINNTPETFSLVARKYQEDSPLPVEEFKTKLAEDKLPTLENAPKTRTPWELSLGKFKSEIEKVKDLGTPESKLITESADDFYESIRSYRGKYVNRFARSIRRLVGLDSVVKNLLKPKEYYFQDTEELKKVTEFFDNKLYNKGKQIELSPAEQDIVNEIRAVLRAVREEQNTKEGLRTGGFNEDYFPMTPKRSVLKELQTNPNSPESLKLKKDFIEYQTNKLEARGTEKEEALKFANKNLEDFMKGWSQTDVNVAKKFGPIDEAEGLGIPESWVEKNAIDRISRYLERVSRRFAYYDAIQTKPGAEKAFEAHMGNESVRAIWDDMTGIQKVEELFRSSAAGLVRASMLGTLTGTKDFVSNLVLGMQHQQNPIQSIRSAIDAWTNMRDNLEDSFLTGVNRVNLNALEWDQGFTDYISGLRRARDIMSDVQGRNFLEQMTRATAFGQGRFITLDYLNQQLNSELSKAGKKFFEDFGKGTDWKSGKLGKSDVNKIAARYVESVQGTYDYRGLPKIAVEGTLSPIFALARWNIEKANNFTKHVINPALNGNIQPLMMATFGMFLGGAAIEALVEQMTGGRKRKSATIAELQASADRGNSIITPAAYKLMGLVSAAGYSGILGDLAKSSMDVIYGKTRPQWYNNVLLDFVDNISSTSFSLVKAVNEDGFDIDIFSEAFGKVIEDNLQLARLVLAHTSAEKKEDIEKANKLRDLRVFNTLEGNPIPDFSYGFIQTLGNEDMEEFKRTEDLGEAFKLLPKLIDRALDKANGNPERLKNELSKIKRNSYQTMPSPERIPMTFIRYLTHLRSSQGPDIAKERLVDYIKQNALNSAKGSAL